MKKIAFIVIVFSAIACNNTEKKKEMNIEDDVSEMEVIEIEETLNKMIDDPENEGSKMLLGKIDYSGLNQDEFEWFAANRKSYEPDSKTIEQLSKVMSEIDIQIFMGTWCEDSQREVPHLFNILKHLRYDTSKIDIIAVSHDKDTPNGYEEGKSIEYVPTIILSKDGKEIGRIVESTQETLEKDLLAIASGKEYKHIYAD